MALARALAADPDLLLLDETLSGLDRMLGERLAVDLARCSAGTRRPLVVTRDHDEAFTLADRVAVLARGTVLQVDTPDQLWRRPVDDEVAAFLGCTAFLSARVRGGVASCALGSVEVDAEEGPARLGFRASGARLRGPGPPTMVPCWVSERVHRHDHVRLAVEVPEVGSRRWGTPRTHRSSASGST